MRLPTNNVWREGKDRVWKTEPGQNQWSQVRGKDLEELEAEGCGSMYIHVAHRQGGCKSGDGDSRCCKDDKDTLWHSRGQSLGELLSRVVAMKNGLWGFTEEVIREGWGWWTEMCVRKRKSAGKSRQWADVWGLESSLLFSFKVRRR